MSRLQLENQKKRRRNIYININEMYANGDSGTYESICHDNGITYRTFMNYRKEFEHEFENEFETQSRTPRRTKPIKKIRSRKNQSTSENYSDEIITARKKKRRSSKKRSDAISTERNKQISHRLRTETPDEIELVKTLTEVKTDRRPTNSRELVRALKEKLSRPI